MRELEFLKEIEAQGNTDHLPLLRDSFTERGPRGEHLCLVMDLYSTSVSALRRSAPHKALPPYMVRNIVMMLVEALAQLQKMRIVHTGRFISLADRNSSRLIHLRRRQIGQPPPRKLAIPNR